MPSVIVALRYRCDILSPRGTHFKHSLAPGHADDAFGGLESAGIAMRRVDGQAGGLAQDHYREGRPSTFH
jgi:hypothetical protein